MNTAEQKAQQEYPPCEEHDEQIENPCSRNVTAHKLRAAYIKGYAAGQEAPPLAMSEEEIEKEADKWWGSEEYNRCDSTTEALKVFAMRMLANTRSKSLTVEKGRTFTEGEVKAMLADIGHHSIVFITTGEFHRHIISTAERHGVVFDPA